MRQDIQYHLAMLVISCVVVTVMIALLPVTQTKAAPTRQFSPPLEIKLEMYALRNDGSINTDDYSDPHCSPTGETSDAYGCTWYYDIPGQDDERVEIYPFASYEIEIGYGWEEVNGFQQGYLHNVVPQEIAIEVSSQDNKALSTLKAQVIAARTFAYNQTYDPSNPTETLRIDNSALKQVYIPYRYDDLTPAQQERVDEAIRAMRYMTLPGERLPIRAHYGADNDAWTTQGSESYLQRVYDPINAAYGTDSGTSYGGMSSRGSSRWGFGHTSSRGPVAPDDPNYPHDSNGDGDLWSVRFDHAEQILTHYYTGIALKGYADLDFIPPYRWLGLWHDIPPDLELDSTHLITMVVQNSGSSTWYAASIEQQNVALSFQILGPGGVCEHNCEAQIRYNLPHDVAPGVGITPTLTIFVPSVFICDLTLRWDMVALSPLRLNASTIDFRFAEQQPPWHPLDVPLLACPHHAYLPSVTWLTGHD